jgi:hypothetical protein
MVACSDSHPTTPLIMDITYKILGTDGKEYGPVNMEQLQGWLKEGRITGAPQILRSDVNAWHPASSYTELGLAAAPSVGSATTQAPIGTAPDQAAIGEVAELEKRLRSGGSWFYWIAGLSLINSIAAFSGSEYGFIVGLSITQIIDHLLAGAGDNARVIALVLDVIAAGVFVLFGVFACKRHVWAFIVGMILYAGDTLLTLVLGLWLGVAFHAWVLFSLFIGVKAAMQVNKLERSS